MIKQKNKNCFKYLISKFFSSNTIKNNLNKLLKNNSISINNLIIKNLLDNIKSEIDLNLFFEILLKHKEKNNFKINIKIIYLVILIMNNKLNYDYDLYLPDNLKDFSNNLKIQSGFFLKYSMFLNGLIKFLFFLKLNYENFVFINSKYEFDCLSFEKLIILAIKINKICLFKIVNYNILNIFKNFHNLKEDIIPFYKLIHNILRKIYKKLFKIIEILITKIFNKNENDTIIIYELYLEFIFNTNVIKGFSKIISDQDKKKFDIPETIFFEINKEKNNKIEKYVYNIRKEKPGLKIISLSVYLENLIQNYGIIDFIDNKNNSFFENLIEGVNSSFVHYKEDEDIKRFKNKKLSLSKFKAK